MQHETDVNFPESKFALQKQFGESKTAFNERMEHSQ